MKRWRWDAVLALLALALFGWLVERTLETTGKANAEKAAALAHADSVAAHDAFAMAFVVDVRHENDSLRTLVAKDSIRNASAQRRERELAKSLAGLEEAMHNAPTETDSLSRALAALAEAHILLAQKDQRIALAESQAAHQAEISGRLQAAVDKLTAQLAEERVNATHLAELLKRSAPPCRIGFLPCPSRAVSFLGGVALTLALLAAIP
jgi:hypothetical protein